MIYYSGIGSRETPQEICNRMRLIADWLAKQGVRLRSGGAFGADLAFQSACLEANGKLVVYRPNGKLQDWWFEEARLVHPAWHKCSAQAKKLHARNTPIILGNIFTPFGFPEKSKFVVCYTKDGQASGGTGQGIRLANKYNIPVFNLYYGRKTELELNSFLEELLI